MNRADILDTALKAVTVDRAATHGKAEDTFGSIAAVWSARLGIEITSAQVAIMLIDLKTCRAWSNPSHADNWVDMAGYAACGGELATDRPVIPEINRDPLPFWKSPYESCPSCGARIFEQHASHCPNLIRP